MTGRRKHDPPPVRTDADDAIAHARQQRRRVERLAERIEPVVRRLENERHHNHIEAAVMAAIRGRQQ